MAGSLKLEDFSRVPPPRPRQTGPMAALAAPDRTVGGRVATSPADGGASGRQEAWDSGYKAGWDDAVRAAAEDEARIRADFARNLRDLGFTYQEARTQVIAALEPLLSDIVGKLLPDLAQAALVPRIVETVMAQAAQAATAPIEIQIAPAARPALDRLFEAPPGLPVTIREEPSLDLGQAVLRFGHGETHVDLTAVVEAARTGIDALYTLTQDQRQERRHG
jgi:flagellar biosynthesis/type III secretory pathway protein FliH